MKKDRYDTQGTDEGETEPGSSGRVLKNLVSVKRKREMDALEYQALIKVTDDSFENYSQSYSFTSLELCKLHKAWLGNLYNWAGSYRQVNMSKKGFPFAAARLIPSLMNQFEKSELKKYTPCNFQDHDKITEALAIVHNEFILIHPFREGNGRMGRLLATIMAVQAGLPPLDFGGIQGKKKLEYFNAVQQGVGKNYEPMRKIFESIVKRTLKINH
ncbi:Fic family protein [Candidatus Berkiella aquae]|uniref:Adenosine monophosphate-protein transferase VbhT n=1 Tax=Candidatus Berkiella aquae TaxID=295108 RepID=A0A0Q9YL30_9GAMM|nr:Fic family protein [Candidatus Berkiella aquae]MCS5710982.1 Fic family protein [Candidatus Berkiella aquae]